MQIFDFKEYKNVIVFGDIHAEFFSLVDKIQRYRITDALVIVAGDCGFGFKPLYYYKELYPPYKSTLEKINVHLLFVRGNHDNPAYFEKKLIDFKYMHTIPDYSVIITKKANILCIGGSISPDRDIRINAMQADSDKELYWPDEMTLYNKKLTAELKKSQLDISHVVSHDCPLFAAPDMTKYASSFNIDAALKEDMTKQMQVLERIYNDLISSGHCIEKWFHGHYHCSQTRCIRKTKFILLDIMEAKAIDAD